MHGLAPAPNLLATCAHDVPSLPACSRAQIKRSELRQAKERLENGVDKIAQASAQVADLQKALKEEQVCVFVFGGAVW